MRLIKIFFVTALLAACSHIPGSSLITPYKIDIQQGNMVTPEMREKIKVGMSPAMVRSVLGEPLVTDPFHANRWDYVFILEQKGKMVEHQRLTLYFENDELVRIDDSHMPAMPAADMPPVLPASAVPAASGVPAAAAPATEAPASAGLATPVPAPAAHVTTEPLQEKK